MSKRIIFDTVRMDRAERTPQGFLRVPAFLTRTGVFRYVNADGSVSKQLRHPDDVFNPASMSTLSGVPFTNEHPRGLVSPENLKNDVVGWIGDNIAIDSIYLKGVVTVADKKAITDVESGKKEVSCGYTADIVDEKGLYNGEEYDCRQKNIIYNHVSLVKRGRAGAAVRLQLDSDSYQFIDNETNIKGEEMVKVTLAGKEFEVTPEVAEALGAEQKTQAQAHDAKLAEMAPKAQLEVAQAKADALEAEVKELKLKKDSSETDKEKFNQAVKARVQLVSKAQKLVKAETKLDDMSDIEIMKAVVCEKYPNVDLKDKSDVYVQARFDHIMETVNEDVKSQDELNRKTKDVADESEKEKPMTSVEARKKMVADSMNAWKTNTEDKI